MLGKINALAEAVFSARLKTGSIHRAKIIAYQKRKSWTKQEKLSKKALNQIKWWRDNLQTLNGQSLLKFKSDYIITTDASTTGWGATLRRTKTQTKLGQACGKWKGSHESKDMCILESIAVLNACKMFKHTIVNFNILIRMNTVSALFYVNKL